MAKMVASFLRLVVVAKREKMELLAVLRKEWYRSQP